MQSPPMMFGPCGNLSCEPSVAKQTAAMICFTFENLGCHKLSHALINFWITSQFNTVEQAVDYHAPSKAIHCPLFAPPAPLQYRYRYPL
jgi:hypothetical protein